METLSGALLEAFGELPVSGATIDLCGLRFTVEAIEHNRITQVLVERLPAVIEGLASDEVGAQVSSTADGEATVVPANVPADAATQNVEKRKGL